MSMQYRTTVALITAAASLLGCGGDEPAVASDEHFSTEGPALRYDSYEVLFTNPVCGPHAYGQEVFSHSGELLVEKPADVFCTYDDIPASASRPESPQHKLVSWIDDPDTTEVFFTALSFSNSAVTDALCRAVEERDVKITFVLDSSSDRSKADQLLACQPASGDPERAPRFETRGHTPGIGYAHNKLVLINPGAPTMKLAFGSGNMSSGLVLHHENWHFITLPSDTYFAQAHLCMMNAELEAYSSKSEYRSYMEDCLGRIEHQEEGDIRAYFVPADGGAASDRLMEQLRGAEKVDIAAHRFTYTRMLDALEQLLDRYQVPMRLIADDDMYWAGQGQNVGDNLSFEYYNAKDLESRGAQVRWMETNHDSHLLHHNKFLVIEPYYWSQEPGVWCGAGNLTGTAFNENWENFYWVEIPEVVQAYREQYEHMWTQLATAPEDMPTENVMPSVD